MPELREPAGRLLTLLQKGLRTAKRAKTAKKTLAFFQNNMAGNSISLSGS